MPGGRPTKYDPKHVDTARVIAKLGGTDPEIADAIGVAVSTIKLWQTKYQEFSDAVKVNKPAADERVEASLYKRAVGYECDEVDIRVVSGEIVQTPVRKIYPPDPTAMIFWLKNRQPDRWRETKAIELTGADGGPVKVEKIERVIVDPANPDRA